MKASIVLFGIAAAALAGCATNTVRPDDDPAMLGMRIAVSPEVQASSPELQAEAQRLRAGLEQDLRARGFARLDPNGKPDATLQLTLVKPAPDRWEVKLGMQSPMGAEVEHVSVKRANIPLPDNDQDVAKVADRLLVKLEDSWRVRDFSSTGLTWGGE